MFDDVLIQTDQLLNPVPEPGIGLSGVSDGKIKISNTDTTPNYTENKISTGTGLIASKSNQGADEVLNFGLYSAPTITFTGGSINELGSMVSDVTLNWTSNTDLISRYLSTPVPLIDRARGSGRNGSYTHVGANLLDTTVYTLIVNDGKQTYQYNSTVHFYNRLYYGVNIGNDLDNSDILSLTKEFIIEKETQKSFNCTGGKYIWICYPARFGSATFKINGFITTFTTFVNSVVNDNGYEENYYCYRSNSIQNGSNILVEVI